VSGLSPSESLKLKIRLAEPRLVKAVGQFWTHPRLSDVFPKYLFRLYCSMRASVPLMATARDRARVLAHDCPVAAGLVPYITVHMEEELHHDEWLLEDMEVLGLRRSEILSRTADPGMAELIGTLYYWVLYGHPVALLAYFAVSEGCPMSARVLDRVAERQGVPKECMRTLYKHAELDVGHGDEVYHLLDSLPISPSHDALLGITAITFIGQLTRIVEGLLTDASEIRRMRTQLRRSAMR
jgi:hypothetical protein